jgi:hypothetical protein
MRPGGDERDAGDDQHQQSQDGAQTKRQPDGGSEDFPEGR